MEEAETVTDAVAQADEITMRLTAAIVDAAREEILDLEERGVPSKLARHYGVVALQRAALAIQWGLSEAEE